MKKQESMIAFSRSSSLLTLAEAELKPIKGSEQSFPWGKGGSSPTHFSLGRRTSSIPSLSSLSLTSETSTLEPPSPPMTTSSAAALPAKESPQLPSLRRGWGSAQTRKAYRDLASLSSETGLAVEDGSTTADGLRSIKRARLQPRPASSDEFRQQQCLPDATTSTGGWGYFVDVPDDQDDDDDDEPLCF